MPQDYSVNFRVGADTEGLQEGFNRATQATGNFVSSVDQSTDRIADAVERASEPFIKLRDAIVTASTAFTAFEVASRAVNITTLSIAGFSSAFARAVGPINVVDDAIRDFDKSAVSARAGVQNLRNAAAGAFEGIEDILQSISIDRALDRGSEAFRQMNSRLRNLINNLDIQAAKTAASRAGVEQLLNVINAGASTAADAASGFASGVAEAATNSTRVNGIWRSLSRRISSVTSSVGGFFTARARQFTRLSSTIFTATRTVQSYTQANLTAAAAIRNSLNLLSFVGSFTGIGALASVIGRVATGAIGIIGPAILRLGGFMLNNLLSVLTSRVGQAIAAIGVFIAGIFTTFRFLNTDIGSAAVQTSFVRERLAGGISDGIRDGFEEGFNLAQPVVEREVIRVQETVQDSIQEVVPEIGRQTGFLLGIHVRDGIVETLEDGSARITNRPDFINRLVFGVADPFQHVKRTFLDPLLEAFSVFFTSPSFPFIEAFITQLEDARGSLQRFLGLADQLALEVTGIGTFVDATNDLVAILLRDLTVVSRGSDFIFGPPVQIEEAVESLLERIRAENARLRAFFNGFLAEVDESTPLQDLLQRIEDPRARFAQAEEDLAVRYANKRDEELRRLEESRSNEELERLRKIREEFFPDDRVREDPRARFAQAEENLAVRYSRKRDEEIRRLDEARFEEERKRIREIRDEFFPRGVDDVRARLEDPRGRFAQATANFQARARAERTERLLEDFFRTSEPEDPRARFAQAEEDLAVRYARRRDEELRRLGEVRSEEEAQRLRRLHEELFPGGIGAARARAEDPRGRFAQAEEDLAVRYSRKRDEEIRRLDEARFEEERRRIRAIRDEFFPGGVEAVRGAIRQAGSPRDRLAGAVPDFQARARAERTDRLVDDFFGRFGGPQGLRDSLAAQEDPRARFAQATPDFLRRAEETAQQQQEELNTFAEMQAMAFLDNLNRGIETAFDAFIAGPDAGDFGKLGQNLLNAFTASILRNFSAAILKPITDGVANGLLSSFSNSLTNIGTRIGELLSNVLSGVGGGLFSGIGRLLGFQDGGVVPGRVGQPQVAVVHGGEAIFNPQQLEALSAGGGGQQIFNFNIQGDVTRETRATVISMLPEISNAVSSANYQRRRL